MMRESKIKSGPNYARKLLCFDVGFLDGERGDRIYFDIRDAYKERCDAANNLE